ncbi:hypothetical protein J5J10_19035 [Ciceribacter sp. L1K23]|uniref:hypothetical protein n=1 Tax=Ciceribacter sp. L1K23 TaxID=2820276 RepID=UPI001B82876C|nr:hypothetical protein [Ciceribacter sp. L1K23]MBR0557787.1 hypothetical protein [Ciceribacter sp. L1K23]
MGSLTLNLFLCFVNTRVFGIGQSHLMLAEMAVVGTALVAAMSRQIGLYAVAALFCSYIVFLSALRQENDLKVLRDVLIAIAFYFMGLRSANLKLADRLVAASAVLVLLVGFFEYFATDVYLQYFNILGYYIARGTIKVEEAFGATTGLFGSGMRPEARTLLPFLGEHRVSSVFLEPVSAGNYGALIYCWALTRAGMRWRRFVVMAALAVIIMADARFGFFTCILVTLLLPFFRIIPKLVWFVAPFLLLAALASYGIISQTDGGANDIAGRFNVTAHLLAQLSPSVVFGWQTTDQFTADSGFAYTLTQFGIVGFIMLWGAAVYAPARTAGGWRFHAAVLVYLLLLMLISNSFYSIKTAGLMWFLVGVMDKVDLAALGQRPRAAKGTYGESSLPGTNAPAPHRSFRRNRKGMAEAPKVGAGRLSRSAGY